jgi:hypothetical protein
MSDTDREMAAGGLALEAIVGDPQRTIGARHCRAAGEPVGKDAEQSGNDQNRQDDPADPLAKLDAMLK